MKQAFEEASVFFFFFLTLHVEHIKMRNDVVPTYEDLLHCGVSFLFTPKLRDVIWCVPTFKLYSKLLISSRFYNANHSVSTNEHHHYWFFFLCLWMHFWFLFPVPHLREPLRYVCFLSWHAISCLPFSFSERLKGTWNTSHVFVKVVSCFYRSCEVMSCTHCHSKVIAPLIFLRNVMFINSFSNVHDFTPWLSLLLLCNYPIRLSDDWLWTADLLFLSMFDHHEPWTHLWLVTG